MSTVLNALTHTGVARQGDWSLKAWPSASRGAWLVQVEHYLPQRGGWIRAWLAAGEGPQQFRTLDAAFHAIEAFLSHPQWEHCQEFAGV